MLRWHFTTGETGSDTSATWVVDHGPDGKHGLGYSVNSNTPSNWVNLPYDTLDEQVEGAYGMLFRGGDSANRRIRAADVTKFHGQNRLRIILGFFARPIEDRPFGVLYSSSNLTLHRLPSGALRVIFRGQNFDVPNIFSDFSLSVIEVEIIGNEITVYQNFTGVGMFASNEVIDMSPSSFVTIGNQSSGGRPSQGFFNYLGVYVGDLSEGEIAWSREQAKEQIENRPGQLLNLDAVPSPLADDVLRFTVMPETIPNNFQESGQVVTLVSGRAIDGLNGPIDFKSRVLFGPIAGAGEEIDIKNWSFLPQTSGYVTFEQIADNGVHTPVVARKILPVAEQFPVLNASQIGQRLGAVVGFIDNFDAGFPPDMVWRPENVVDPGDGTVGLRIIKNTGPGRPNTGASVQFRLEADADPSQVVSGAHLFSVDWYFQLIDTRGPTETKGYMQTGFTFTHPWQLPRRELDFEYNSNTGLMECTIHLAANGGGPGSAANGIHIHPPEDAFTGQRKWSIVSNADRTEWFYEDQLCARYIRGQGWDSSVQDFQPVLINSGVQTPFLPGDTYMHPRDEHWHLNRQNIFIQHWMTDTNAAWLGPNTVPIDHPLLRFSQIDALEFGPVGTALQAADWTAVSSAAGEVTVEVSNYRPNRFHPTHLEYSIDGGSWQRLPGAFGPQTISGLSSGVYNIQLRPVAESIATDPSVTASTYILEANPSDTKTVTVS